MIRALLAITLAAPLLVACAPYEPPGRGLWSLPAHTDR